MVNEKFSLQFHVFLSMHGDINEKLDVMICGYKMIFDRGQAHDKDDNEDDYSIHEFDICIDLVVEGLRLDAGDEEGVGTIVFTGVLLK